MGHIPVLLKETIDGLKLGEGMTVLDATLGGGGHAKKICEAIGKDGTLLGIDADAEAVERVGKMFQKEGGCRSTFFISNFKEVSCLLESAHVGSLDAAMFDLGLSSYQLDVSGRGFSFMRDEPLIMTFDKEPKENAITAREIVNKWEENNLADIIYGYGGERYAKRIAKAIVLARENAPINTTFELVRVIESAVPVVYRRRKIHFATKTFQAIRITVNDELSSIRKALAETFKKLKQGGRIAIISFHELEDRIVKVFFREKAKEGAAMILTKKPTVPGEEEVARNPRARSAKLRIAEKII